jgi:hypothetical protein
MLRVHEDVLRQGWALTSATEMGLATAATRDALSPALAPDPRGAGKLHARDVVRYDRTGASLAVTECESIAHGDVTSFPRCHLVRPAAGGGDLVPRTVLRMVPAAYRRPSGRLSADYFRYFPGAESIPHQDKFGDMVIIWVLDRDGDGGGSFLLGDGGDEVFHRELMVGEMLIFRDELFRHGVMPMRGDGAFRDALVFITLLDSM